MCYEATIASVGGDETTVAKSLIISLEDAVANWYSKLPPRCIYSWQQLKEKFLLNFQGLQAELGTKEDFLSCAQREKETLPDFYRRFLKLKAPAPEVSDDQVIAQAIKALRVGPLHSHLVRERPKTVPELYEQFVKFSKLEVQHFHKLEHQRKNLRPDEAQSSPHFNDSQPQYPKPVHIIDFDGGGPPEIWEKNFGMPSQERIPRSFNQRSTQCNQRGDSQNRGRGRGRGRGLYTFRPPYCMYHDSDTDHQTKVAQFSLSVKGRWSMMPNSLRSNQDHEK
jgi:hypothetical protein